MQKQIIPTVIHLIHPKEDLCLKWQTNICWDCKWAISQKKISLKNQQVINIFTQPNSPNQGGSDVHSKLKVRNYKKVLDLQLNPAGGLKKKTFMFLFGMFAHRPRILMKKVI